jgi:hypothetical protein
MTMIRKNEDAIARVRAALTERGTQSNATLMAHTKLSKSQVQGAIRSLTLEGAVESEGATMNRVHRLKGDTRTAAPSAPAGTKKARKKQAAKTRPTPAVNITSEPATAHPLAAHRAAAPTTVLLCGVTAERGLLVVDRGDVRVYSPEQTLELASAVFAHFEAS